MNAFYPQEIFNPRFDFEKYALSLFHIQARFNPVYKEFLQLMKVDPHQIQTLKAIPFLPVELFKNQRVYTHYDFGFDEPDVEFISSGTQGEPSHHYLKPSWYEQVCQHAFEHFYGSIKDYIVLALLPSYLERKQSSLVYMIQYLQRAGNHPESGFFPYDYEKLLQRLIALKNQEKKIWLIGVTYALLDFAEVVAQNGMNTLLPEIKNLIVMETGGMKGRRQEMTRQQVHALLKEKTGVSVVHSEYGMTELMTQAYSKENGLFFSPPWMKVMIRSLHDPAEYEPGGHTGVINIIDLANLFSCAFLSTRDLGKCYADGSFEVLGRADNSDIRGCNLLIS
jgi:phenylacetate-coenzyme A ligase PaaK-like adenylate-forming protein